MIDGHSILIGGMRLDEKNTLLPSRGHLKTFFFVHKRIAMSFLLDTLPMTIGSYMTGFNGFYFRLNFMINSINLTINYYIIKLVLLFISSI